MANHPGRRRVAVERAAISKAHDHDHDYSALLLGVRESFGAAIARGPLFLTDAAALNAFYLDSLPAERQTHDCHACRRFIEVYGAIATVDDNGALRSAMWRTEAPEFYSAAFANLGWVVEKAKIISPFRSKDETWGVPITGAWSHMAVTPPRAIVHRSLALTAGQAMAAAKENYRTVAAALGEFKAPMIDQAIRLLEADALVRAERFVAPLRWLRGLHDRPRGRAGENLLWRAIATAPEGYCHPRAAITGSLIEDIQAGLAFEDIQARWAAKMHPLQYQRPQAAPSAGNIKSAEALVEKLGVARSLERRFARLDEVETIWRPSEKETRASAGVFGHLAPKGVSRDTIDIAAPTMTWEKFARIALPGAARIELLVPPNGNFEAYLTATHDDAPLIFKWGNSFSGYVYHNGSRAVDWGLQPGMWCPVLAIISRPNLWGDPQLHLGEGVMLALEGAEDSRSNQGNAIFPETLKPELHAIRSTIEAYSKSAVIGRVPGPLASGYGLGKGTTNYTLRVASGAGWTVHKIDRWN